MKPIRFAKEHPVAVVLNMGLGMVIGPPVLAAIARWTGVSISLPTLRGKAE